MRIALVFILKDSHLGDVFVSTQLMLMLSKEVTHCATIG